MCLMILKVGGSLLASPDLATELPQWCDFLREDFETAERPNERVRVGLVIGGGSLVDVVRHWEPVHRLSDQTSHQLAISALHVTAKLVAEILGCPVVRLPRLAENVGIGYLDGWNWPDFVGPVVLDVAQMAAGGPLPASWDVTSDSLALWVARREKARRLVLLKAVNPLEKTVKIGKIQDLGWIDSYFSRMWCEGGGPEIPVQIAHYFHRPRTVSHVEWCS